MQTFKPGNNADIEEVKEITEDSLETPKQAYTDLQPFERISSAG